MSTLRAGWGRTPSFVPPEPARHEGDSRVAEWLIGLRWLAVLAGAATTVGLTTATAAVDPRAVLPLWVVLIALVAMNATLSVVGSGRAARDAWLATQLAGDAVAVGVVTHLLGGIASPVAGLFLVHAVVVAMVLRPAAARRHTVALALGLALLTAFEATGVAPPLCAPQTSASCGELGVGALLLGGSLTVGLVLASALFVVAIVESVVDERQRVLAGRAELANERMRLQTIVDCMADAVLFADGDGRIRLHNRAARALWSTSTPHDDLRVCHDAQTWERMLERLRAAGALELHPTLEIGERLFEATYANVRNAEGPSEGVVMVERDVTARVRAEHVRARGEKLAVIGKLAASLAHELNNPLGAIVLFVRHALRRSSADDPIREHLETVLRNAEQCSGIVRDLLENARQREPSVGAVALRELLGDIVRTLGPRAERGRVAVEVDTAREVPPTWPADGDQLRQILVNLGLNAIEAMEHGGTVRFETELDDPRTLRIRVTDTGPGIAPAELGRIFDEFFTTKVHGTGLGLAVARTLVGLHDGKLLVQSEVGHGTAFTVLLPRREP